MQNGIATTVVTMNQDGRSVLLAEVPENPQRQDGTVMRVLGRDRQT
jgi:hypothetical protein